MSRETWRWKLLVPHWMSSSEHRLKGTPRRRKKDFSLKVLSKIKSLFFLLVCLVKEFSLLMISSPRVTSFEDILDPAGKEI